MKEDKRVNVWVLISGIFDIILGTVLGFFASAMALFTQIFTILGDKIINNIQIYFIVISFLCLVILIFGIFTVITASSKNVHGRKVFLILGLLLELIVYGSFFIIIVMSKSQDMWVFVLAIVACIVPVLRLIGLCANRTTMEILPEV